ncbi:MAG: HAMP domain-containing histidine kinase [Methanomicrobiales archaeon]|nr:HAMP domain-containing histidine kinase [Methanomicrobiales archaeon]
MAAKSFIRSSFPLMIYLLLVVLLVVAPVIYLTSYSGYTAAQQELEDDIEELQGQTEYGIVLAVNLVDTGLELFDASLDREMEEGFGPFVAEYERAGRDPGAMDLSRVKEQLGGRMDLYIINELGVIEYTTYPPEFGYDFQDIPEFYNYITDIRLNSGFSADRIVPEFATGMLRKYAYQPSPDRRYLFELGLAESEFGEPLTALSYIDAVREVVDGNPYVNEVRIFDCLGGRIVGAAHPDDDRRMAAARQAYRERTTLEVEDAATGGLIRYLFIDGADSEYASDMSMVVELTYTARVAEEMIGDMFARHVGILLAGFALIALLSAVAMHFLTQPVRTLVEDVDAVARGDLDRPIRVGGSEEFVRLGMSVSTMVASLKETLQRLQDSEDEIARRNRTLEAEVRERTAALEESNRMTSLLLDIMGHDINSANNVANLYSDLLLTDLKGEPEEDLLWKAKAGLMKSIDIVRNVNTIQRIQGQSGAFRAITLDPVIRSEIEHLPTSRITYTGTTVSVIADDLLAEVFSNLLGNAMKHGGPDVDIAVMVEDNGAEVTVSVEDTGPGVPDRVKPRLFNRLSRGESGVAGTGLGLYICRMLIERYGGRIRVDDRVPGHPESGTAIRFTLKKAEGGEP